MQQGQKEKRYGRGAGADQRQRFVVALCEHFPACVAQGRSTNTCVNNLCGKLRPNFTTLAFFYSCPQAASVNPSQWRIRLIIYMCISTAIFRGARQHPGSKRFLSRESAAAGCGPCKGAWASRDIYFVLFFISNVWTTFLTSLSPPGLTFTPAVQVRYIERFMELIIDLLSQLPTRRFFRFTCFVCVPVCLLAKMERRGLAHDLVQLN